MVAWGFIETANGKLKLQGLGRVEMKKFKRIAGGLPRCSLVELIVLYQASLSCPFHIYPKDIHSNLVCSGYLLEISYILAST